ncbi:hypothetical protein [Candidatus Hecatella orcuttiae]|uniref:hypothetical protein n=1 Tax=Candidatus Hecatella orcuttiae TaxID=1935119 RepID=UPI00286828FD|nr:hypothetical protein [Candidatus Hecatella orcuttiae]
MGRALILIPRMLPRGEFLHLTQAASEFRGKTAEFWSYVEEKIKPAFNPDQESSP